MGFFDYMRCEVPINGRVYDEVFQCKFADSSMNNYLIKLDGTLWVEKGSVFDDATGVNQEFIDSDGDSYHGDIIFYGKELEFKARFSSGKLDWIKEIV